MNNRTILLVEDNPDDVDLTARALRKFKVANELVVARDGEEALEYLLGDAAGNGATLPQLVLLDLKLPRVDGLEVLKRIRAADRTRMLPVVILTSSREEQDIMAGYSLGANSYVRKPVNFDEFVDSVNQLGLYWLILNEPPPEGSGP